jgi:predicted flavoprotein YhiN
MITIDLFKEESKVYFNFKQTIVTWGLLKKQRRRRQPFKTSLLAQPVIIIQSRILTMILYINRAPPLTHYAPIIKPSKRQRITCNSSNSASSQPHIAVIGAGAAGLAAAYFAAESGAVRVTLVEKTPEAGKKILISGGTRCNVLPGSVDPATDYFTESSASALRSIFSRWSLDDCRDWISDPNQIGIELAYEEETNKLFPASNEAREVRDRLVSACKRRGVTFMPSAAIEDLHLVDNYSTSAGNTSENPLGKHGPSWECLLLSNSSGGTNNDNSSLKTKLTADRIILATGGKSFPGLGTIGTGYEILKKLGHELHQPYAALTPLLGTHPGHEVNGEQLPGLSVYSAELSIKQPKLTDVNRSTSNGTTSGSKISKKPIGSSSNKKKRGKTLISERTALLLTHRGFSGPAAMDLSHYFSMAEERKDPAPKFLISWIKEMDRKAWEQALTDFGGSGSVLVVNILKRNGVPARLADALCAQAGVVPGRKLPELRKEERIKLLEALTACELQVKGHEGYPKAEVTGGGVPLNELNCATMESKVAPGVHICGELCDVHGRIGGFNFYWAWCSGRLAGLGAAAAVAKAGEEKQ